MPGKKINLIRCFLVGWLLVAAGCRSDDKPYLEISADLQPVRLPMDSLDLNSLKAFKGAAKNWFIAGDAYADFQRKHDLHAVDGSGVLVNQPDSSQRDNLFTSFSHGDMELEVEFMMPRGSNSGIYFQGRYEIQLLDSWRVEVPTHGDCGGIYQRWDASKGKGREGFEGRAPKVNACKAPGLWQHLRVLFRAPRFDSSGKKLSPAKFEHVFLNGFQVHEDVSVSGPTRAAFSDDEVPLGPLMLQGDHGPVAFRNFKYRLLTADSLTLTDLRFARVEGKFDRLPTLNPRLPSGARTDVLDVAKNAGVRNNFALQYTGKLDVSRAGDYLFNVLVDDGAALFIDDRPVLIRDDRPGQAFGKITLTKGVHDFRLDYFQRESMARVLLYYEGPGIYPRLLASPFRVTPVQQDTVILVKPDSLPEMIRSFVRYRDTIRTHVISVGDPRGVHFTFDLSRGQLIQAWRGMFGDAYGMWHERGETQLLQPGNFCISPVSEPDPVQVVGPGGNGQHAMHGYRFEEYSIDRNGSPAFHYTIGDLRIKDQVVARADSTGLDRSIEFSGPASDTDRYYQIASGPRIRQLPNGLYSFDGRFYIGMEGASEPFVIREKALVVPLLKNKISTRVHYRLIW